MPSQKTVKVNKKYAVGEKITALFLALLSAIMILGFSGNGYLDISQFKYRMFLSFVGGYILVMAVAGLETALINKNKRLTFKTVMKNWSWPQYLLILFLVCTLISAGVSEYGGVTLVGSGRYDGLLTIALYVLSFLLVSRFARPAKWMVYVFDISIILFCVLSIIQLTGANPLTLYPEGYNYYGAGVRYSGEYIGTLGNTDLCAGVLCLSAGITAMCVIKSESRREWILLIPLVLVVFIIIEIRVAAGYVGLFGGLLIMLPVAVTGKKTLSRALSVYGFAAIGVFAGLSIGFFDGGAAVGFSKISILAAVAAVIMIALGSVTARANFIMPSAKKVKRILAAVVVLAILAAFIFTWFYRAPESGTVYEAHEVLHGNWDDNFGSGRVYIWKNVLDLVAEKPFFGGGPDTLGLRGIAPFQRYDDTLGAVLQGEIDTAHNEYLNIMVNEGILAFLAYAAAVSLMLIKWFKHPENTVMAVSGAAILFYSIQAFFGISMCFSTVFLWMAFAVFENKRIIGDGKK